MSDATRDNDECVHYGPTDPEYYLDESRQDPVATLAASLGYAVYRFVRRAVLSILESPLNRVFLLQCVQSELVRDGRLPHGGFGGIRGTVHYIIAKEGILGLFRGALANTILSVPVLIAGRLAAFGVFIAQERLAPICGPLVLLVGIAAPALRVALTAPFVGYKYAMYCNYAADIVAPHPAVPSDCHDGNAKAEKKKKKKAEEELNEAYDYATPWEAVAAVRRRCGWRGIFYKHMEVDLVAAYATVLVMQIVERGVMPNVMGFVREHVRQPRRQVAALTTCLMGVCAVYNFVTQPFHVIRIRMTLLPPAADGERRKPKYRYCNIWQCAKEIVKRDGITALWAGTRWRLIRETSALVLSVLLRRG